MSKKDKDLTAFGKYLLSKERWETLFPRFTDKGEPSCHNGREVYHSDLENWKALQEKGK